MSSSGYLFSNGVFALKPLSKEGGKLLKDIAARRVSGVHFGFNGEGLCVRNICVEEKLIVSNGKDFLEVPVSVSAFVPPGGQVKFNGHIFKVIKIK